MSPQERQDAEFDEFVTGVWRRLQWTAYLLTGERYLAEDLVQTALVKVYARWSRVRREDAFAYTRRVLVNANTDRLRRTHLREVSGTTIDQVEIGERAPDQVEQRDEIVRMLAPLTTRERRVVVLRYYCDLSESDVAEELSVSVGTVKSTTSRAIAKLRLVDETMRGVS